MRRPAHQMDSLGPDDSIEPNEIHYIFCRVLALLEDRHDGRRSASMNAARAVELTVLALLRLRSEGHMIGYDIDLEFDDFVHQNRELIRSRALKRVLQVCLDQQWAYLDTWEACYRITDLGRTVVLKYGAEMIPAWRYAARPEWGSHEAGTLVKTSIGDPYFIESIDDTVWRYWAADDARVRGALIDVALTLSLHPRPLNNIAFHPAYRNYTQTPGRPRRFRA